MNKLELELKAQNELKDKFNKCFKVGEKVPWRSNKFADYQNLTLQSEAFMNYGNAVAFFNEKRGFLSIEPDFVMYP